MEEVRLTLTDNITALDLAMVGDGEEGYQPDYVIGPTGTTVTLLADEGEWVRVTGFTNDPYAEGFVRKDQVDLVELPCVLTDTERGGGLCPRRRPGPRGGSIRPLGG